MMLLPSYTPSVPLFVWPDSCGPLAPLPHDNLLKFPVVPPLDFPPAGWSPSKGGPTINTIDCGVPTQLAIEIADASSCHQSSDSEESFQSANEE